MIKALLIAFGILMLPAPVDASFYEGMRNTFGPGGPAEPVAWLVYLSIGRWVIVTVSTTFGHLVFGQGVDVICRCVAVGIVLRAVMKLLGEAFGILGI